MHFLVIPFLHSQTHPQTEGVGTIRSNKFNIGALQDDGGLSSDTEDSDDEDEFVDASDITPPLASPLLSRSPAEMQFTEGVSGRAALLSISVNSPDTPTPGAIPTPVPNIGMVEPTPKASAGFAAHTIASGRFNPKNIVRKLSGITGSTPPPHSPVVESPSNLVNAPPPMMRSASKDRRLFGKRGSSSSSGASSGTENTVPSATTPTTPLSALSVLGAGKRKESHYEYKKGQDIVGIVMLEIQGADNLPKWANSK
jgi:phosphatidylserine decarboxylase